jgi:2-iminobutanoate/2-iminopropanoate deaminase
MYRFGSVSQMQRGARVSVCQENHMKVVDCPSFPKPKGPFSYAVTSQGFVFVSGLASIDLATNEFKLGDIKAEAKLTLLNIKQVLEAAGTSLDHVVSCSVYLKDINDFAALNEIYETFFPHVSKRPARVTVQAVLGSDIKVEIDAIAELPGKDY